VVTAKIAIKDIVKDGFETLLSPSGDQVKVLVNARG
jgi:(R,R)-butanediol dehydrogenase/meso-butanediol dehydrogenase/diacetyl reductase